MGEFDGSCGHDPGLLIRWALFYEKLVLSYIPQEGIKGEFFQ